MQHCVHQLMVFHSKNRGGPWGEFNTILIEKILKWSELTQYCCNLGCSIGAVPLLMNCRMVVMEWLYFGW
jgi:hypothetical protein